MATETNNLKLNKPDITDFYNIDLVNVNMDKIDEAIGEKANKGDIPSIPDSLPANGGNADTLGGKTQQEFFGNAINQPPNYNLNDISKTGLYEIRPSAASNPTINSPMNAWGLCIHYEHSSMKHQTVLFAYGDYPMTTRRTYTGSAWTKWVSDDDFRKSRFKTLSNGSSLFAYILNTMPDYTSDTIRVYDGVDIPTKYGYVAGANDFLFHIDKLDNGYSMIKAKDNRGNREFMIRSGNGVWQDWKEVCDGGNADTVDGQHVNLGVGNWGLKPICASTNDVTAGVTGLQQGHVLIVYE